MTLFLVKQRIEIAKNGVYIMLVLFSIGMTKGKWAPLLDSLLAFKRDHDQNTPPPDTLPKLAATHPDRSERLGSLTSATTCTTFTELVRRGA